MFQALCFSSSPRKKKSRADISGERACQEMFTQGETMRCSNIDLKASIDGRAVYPSCWHQMVARSTSRLCRLRLKCDGTSAETRLRSAKWTSPFKSAGASVQSTTGSRGACISGSNAGYTMFRGSVKSTRYPLHSPVTPSLPLPCVTVCHHISTGL